MIPDLEVQGARPETDVEYIPGEGVEELLQEWAESNLEIAALLDIYKEDLKTETDIHKALPTEPNNNDNNNTTTSPPPTTTDTNPTTKDNKKAAPAAENGDQPPATSDGPPDDIRAFYGHPLTAAAAGSSDADTHASAVALIHEYINLPALDRSGMKIGEKIDSIYDIMRDDGSAATCKSDPAPNDIDVMTAEYLHLLQSSSLGAEVDKFFSRDGNGGVIITDANGERSCFSRDGHRITISDSNGERFSLENGVVVMAGANGEQRSFYHPQTERAFPHEASVAVADTGGGGQGFSNSERAALERAVNERFPHNESDVALEVPIDEQPFSQNGTVVSIDDEEDVGDLCELEDGCSVGVAEEVIGEICVEAECLDSDPDTSGDLFPSIAATSDSDASEVIAAAHMVKPDETNLDISMPVLCGLNPEPAGLVSTAVTTVPIDGPPKEASPARVTSSSSSSSRKSRESKSHAGEKLQELPKKLVKALTEKIRRNQQNDKPDTSDSRELEAAVSNLPVSTVSTSNSPSPDVIAYTKEPSLEPTQHQRLPKYPDTAVTVFDNDVTIVEDTGLVTSSLPVSTHVAPPLYSSSQTNTLPAISLPAKPPPPPLPHKLPPPHPVEQQPQQPCSNVLPTQHLTQEKPPCLIPPPRNVCVQGEITKHPQFLRNNSVPCNTTNQSYNSAQAQQPPSINNYATDPNHNPATVPPYPPFFYPNYPGSYMFPTMQRPRPTGSADRDIMLERYIQQQNQFFSEHPSYQQQYSGPMKENYSMKSPDSGYNEACVSPKEQNQVQYKKNLDQGTNCDKGTNCDQGANEGTDEVGTEDSKGAKVSKRRRSAPAMYVKQYWNPAEKIVKPIVPKLEKDPAGYRYILETPISTNQRVEEDRMTYMNKGQYYALTLEHNGERPIKSQMVKSVIMVVFREDKHLDDERKTWEFWHSRQHSYKQRVIDIDTKNSTAVMPSSVDEIAFNGVAVRWNPRDSPVKVNVAIHCLSTDFSNQKGVKGLPMHVQIDTYENTKDSYPISRAYNQIKIFCDKGAERKTRDEERRKQCRVKPETHGKVSRKRHEEVFHEPTERSEFYIMADLTTQPVLFSPKFEAKFEGDESNRTSPLNMPSHDEDGSSSITSSGDHYDSTEDSVCPIKRPRTDSYSSFPPFSNILLYVREKHEVVFTAVMLRSPTLQGLLQAVEEKYKIPASKITNSYKRSKKGILVRMDDNIIRHYSHESTFIIELNRIGESQESELILTEIDTT